MATSVVRPGAEAADAPGRWAYTGGMLRWMLVVFLALVLINLVCIPTGMDLLQFAKDAPTMVIVGWIQFGALILAALCTLRPSLGRWLPPSRGLSPVKAMRRDGSL